MTLRDFFAGLAMLGLLSKHGGYEDDMTSPSAVRAFSEKAPTVEEVAQYAYAMASEMLKQGALATHEERPK